MTAINCLNDCMRILTRMKDWGQDWVSTGWCTVRLIQDICYTNVHKMHEKKT